MLVMGLCHAMGMLSGSSHRRGTPFTHFLNGHASRVWFHTTSAGPMGDSTGMMVAAPASAAQHGRAAKAKHMASAAANAAFVGGAILRGEEVVGVCRGRSLKYRLRLSTHLKRFRAS